MVTRIGWMEPMEPSPLALDQSVNRRAKLFQVIAEGYGSIHSAPLLSLFLGLDKVLQGYVKLQKNGRSRVTILAIR